MAKIINNSYDCPCHGVSEHYGTLVAHFSNSDYTWTVASAPDGSFDPYENFHNCDIPAINHKTISANSTYYLYGRSFNLKDWLKESNRIKANYLFKKSFNSLLEEEK